MSIVLAIIGLIVGGILKGQEVVNSARLKSQVSQVDKVKSAVFSFQDQYNYLPGDYPLATQTLQLGTSGSAVCANANGCGNGLVGAYSAGGGALADAATEVAVSGTESILAWAHLNASNLLGGVQGVTAANVTTTANITYPGKITGDYLYFATFSYAGSGTTIQSPMVRLQGVTAGAATAPSSSATSGQAVREQDANSVDVKYDDGVPTTGSILASLASTTACMSSTNQTYTPSVGTSTLNCTMLFLIQ
jgi:hypothetical protein